MSSLFTSAFVLYSSDGWNVCKFISFEDDCNYYFSYKYQQRDINLKVQKTKGKLNAT